MRKTKEMRKIRVWRKKGKEKKRAPIPDVPKSLVRELKLVYSTRATSRCQKTKVLGFSPTLIPFNLRVVNDRVVQPQPWD